MTEEPRLNLDKLVKEYSVGKDPPPKSLAPYVERAKEYEAAEAKLAETDSLGWCAGYELRRGFRREVLEPCRALVDPNDAPRSVIDKLEDKIESDKCVDAAQAMATAHW